MSLLSLKDVVVKKDKRTILELEALEVREGASYAIIGPNGAGKTTLLMCLARLEKTVSGRIFFRNRLVGRDVTDNEFRKKIAVVFQQPLLFNMSVFENVAYGLKLRNYARKEIAARVAKSLEYFGIGGLSSRSSRAISGGEAQRVCLARSLALEPEVLLLDEPFTSLDAPTSEKIMFELKDVIGKTGTTLLLVTHNKLEALNLAGELIVLERGRIVQQGKVGDVFSRPANEFVAAFSGIDAVLSGTVVENYGGMVAVKIATKTVMATGDFAVGSTVRVCLRPENILISQENPGESSARNRFAARVVDSVPYGYYHKVILDCGFLLSSIVTNSTAAAMGITAGQEVFIAFKATAVHLIRE